MPVRVGDDTAGVAPPILGMRRVRIKHGGGKSSILKALREIEKYQTPRT